jgi:hypothetical protein
VSAEIRVGAWSDPNRSEDHFHVSFEKFRQADDCRTPSRVSTLKPSFFKRGFEEIAPPNRVESYIFMPVNYDPI